MITNKEKKIINIYAKKYKISKVVLFGSAKDNSKYNDIDIGIKGLPAEYFFDFCWELYRDLPKPLDVIDLSKECLFNKLIERSGIVIYEQN